MRLALYPVVLTFEMLLPITFISDWRLLSPEMPEFSDCIMAWILCDR
jgi:hypothetical protein